MTRSLATFGRRAALAGAVFAAAACGRGPNQSADRNGADTTSADRSALGAPVGENKPANDSAFANAQGTLDSLHAAGVGPKNGLDSTARKVQNQTANEPIRDTSHLNNKATPPGQRSPAQRP